MTVLDLATGQVVKRFHESPRVYSIHATDSGLYVNSRQGRLLDWSTLKPQWAIDGAYDFAIVGSDVLVFNDYWGRQNRLYAVDVTTGNELWALPGEASDVPIIVVGSNALVITEGSRGDPDTVLLLNVVTGEVMSRFLLPERLGESRQYAFDGEQMFVIEHPHDRGNEPVLAFTVSDTGTLIPADEFTPEQGRGQPMQIGAQRFDRTGKLIRAPVSIATPWLKTSRGVDVPGFEEAGSRLTVVPHADSAGGLARLEFVSGPTSWQIVVPHLTSNFNLRSMTLSDKVVLIATSRGNIECLDRATGRSRWMYVSPNLIGLFFYNGGPQGEFVSSILGAYDRDLASANRLMASRVLPAHVDWSKETDSQRMLSFSAPSNSALIQDPEPFDPFLIYRQLVFALRVIPCAFAALAVIIFLRAWRKKTRRLTSIAVGAAGLFLLPVPVLWTYPGYSYFGTYALKAEMVIFASTVIILGGISIKQRQRLVVTTITWAIVIGGVVWGWPLFR